MQKRLECIVSGRVRGVMYRDTACRRAKSLRLTGFVENQEDHATVQVVAEGEEVVLQEFLTYLWKGSPLSSVARIEEKWNEATHGFTDFRIRYRNFLDRF